MQYKNRTEEEKIRLAEELCGYLNELIQCDAKAIHNLCETRVACNAELANHPTVQVVTGIHNNPVVVGLIGVLNGFIGAQSDGWGYIAAVYDEEGRLQRFDLASKFERIEPG
jgi:hypothetical protein